MTEFKKEDSINSIRKSLSLSLACLEDAQRELFSIIAKQEKPVIRRRKFAGECNVIRLDQRKAIGGRP